MRQFHLTYSIAQTVLAQLKLSWYHYIILMRINDINARNFYKPETEKHKDKSKHTINHVL